MSWAMAFRAVLSTSFLSALLPYGDTGYRPCPLLLEPVTDSWHNAEEPSVRLCR